MARAARLGRAAPLAFACGVLGSAGLARAAIPSAPNGGDELANARAAWDRGEFDSAEVLYKSALDQGGLSPKDTLDAYVHLGTARAVMGKKELARAAFRKAAFIDRQFAVPGEGGRKAVAIATLARREEAKLGSIRLAVKVPETVEPEQPFQVLATLDAKHAAETAKVGVDALDSASGKHWAASAVATTKVRFEVPADVSLPGAMLVVRVDALDAHDNRLASHETRVKVNGAPPPPEPEPPPAVATPTYSLPTLSIALDPSAPAAAPESRASHGKGGGFWSTAWPYVIGGVVLAGAGAAVYYETRPSSDVAVGAASLVTH
jgi:hypothetical protein